MKKIRTSVDKIVERLLIAILGIMVLNVLWQVFTRFFTDTPSSFTDELARYLMIWLGILGAAYVAGKNEHVAIDFFAKKFSEKRQLFLTRFISIAVLSFAFFGMVVGGSRLVYITTKLEQFSPSLKIPLAVVYGVIPLSGILIIFYKITQNKK
ncbi:TRAP transporter small permease [Flavobacteriaceae bacterium]|jgi:TRAP-type C4-dicarboxylate transport system permease small subunit|nr:TRAP transporter small permease [Flavobacteriaceae bacterium]MDA9015137.1 TRAP transporter small permease [Flavobacteriaceae bacterium]MDA9843953.1 TRAP transporter small permease [Flavobacteriaceae bacterium]